MKILSCILAAWAAVLLAPGQVVTLASGAVIACFGQAVAITTGLELIENGLVCPSQLGQCVVFPSVFSQNAGDFPC